MVFLLPVGVMNFFNDLDHMLGHRPAFWQYWAVCWVFFSPVFITVGTFCSTKSLRDMKLNIPFLLLLRYFPREKALDFLS